MDLLITEKTTYSSKRRLFAQNIYLFHSLGSHADQIASRRTAIIQINYPMCHNFLSKPLNLTQDFILCVVLTQIVPNVFLQIILTL